MRRQAAERSNLTCNVLKASTTLPNLQALIIYSLPLAQQLSITLLFVGIFLHLQRDTISAELLASTSAICVVLCASTTREKVPSITRKSKPLAQPLSYALLGLVVFSLSPLLKTLTEATTGDSIAALSAALFTLSFILADYSSPKVGKDGSEQESAQLPATLSLNASLCASIVLASRLDNPIQAFALILASMCLFAFLPRWTRQTIPSRPGAPKLPILYTSLLTMTSSFILASFSTTASIINILTAIFLSIICPAWMRRAQDWKVGRRGPWDVGVPKLRSR